MTTSKILLAGEGGQGIQTIAKILSNAAYDQGYQVSYIPSFGVEQRGTPSVAFLTISHDQIFYPRFDQADYVIVLQKRAIAKIKQYIGDKTKVIFDSSTLKSDDLGRNSKYIYGLPATKFAIQNFNPKSFNLIITGKLSHILGLSEESVWQEIEKVLKSKFKDNSLRKSSEEAFLFGRKAVLETKNFSKTDFAPSKHKIAVRGFDKRAIILPERCKGCGICIEKCPVKALAFGETLGVYATPVPDIDLEKCINCGLCKQFCPDAAIYVEKEPKAK